MFVRDSEIVAKSPKIDLPGGIADVDRVSVRVTCSCQSTLRETNETDDLGAVRGLLGQGVNHIRKLTIPVPEGRVLYKPRHMPPTYM